MIVNMIVNKDRTKQENKITLSSAKREIDKLGCKFNKSEIKSIYSKLYNHQMDEIKTPYGNRLLLMNKSELPLLICHLYENKIKKLKNNSNDNQ